MKKNVLVVTILLSILSLSYLTGCKKADIVTATTTDVNMYEYLAKRPESFSEFVKILDKTGYGEFLNAYGSYTLFAPNNDAVKAYLQEVNKASVDALTEAEAQSIVKLHLIADTINTNQFKDGKLPQITMYGQYLLTGVINKAGVSSYIVNREAVVVQPNIRVANGNIHVVDHVLKPATKTLAQLAEANPDYSIFTQALKETGFYDLLNTVNNTDTTKRWLTLLAETNQALRDSGITSYAALKAKYSQTGNPKNTNDSLYLYVAYHILYEAKYLADIVTASSHNTLAPLEVITQTLEGETVLLNDLTLEIEGVSVHEKGVPLERSRSDIAANNGVLHTATAHFAIKNRQPWRVDFDVADQIEFRRAGVFGRTGFTLPFGNLMQDITWDPAATSSVVSYAYSGPTSSNFFVWRGDYLILAIGLTNAARAKWIEFRTPLIVKGRYKVWVCYRQQKSSTNNPAFPLRTSIKQKVQTKDSVTVMQRLFDFQETRPSGTASELEALGWKNYTSETTSNTMVSRLLGTVDIQVTDRHIFRIDALSGSGQSTNNLDIIQFIPINMDQLSPRFRRDGTKVP